MKHLPSYKGNREYGDFLGGPFFKLAYYDNLFIKGGASKIMKYPELEADDCLAILTKKLKNTFPDGKVTIITSDMDYLQLACENVELYDLDKPEDDLMFALILKNLSDRQISIDKKLIDFNEIPEDLVNNFMNHYELNLTQVV